MQPQPIPPRPVRSEFDALRALTQSARAPFQSINGRSAAEVLAPRKPRKN